MNYDKRCCRLRRWTVPCAMLFLFSLGTVIWFFTIAIHYENHVLLVNCVYVLGTSPMFFVWALLEYIFGKNSTMFLNAPMPFVVLFQYFFLWWSGCMWLQSGREIRWYYWVVILAVIAAPAVLLSFGIWPE